MNLGDGLLFEFENGKPKLILLSHGVEKNPAKLLFRPRAANNILSSRQLSSCLEEVQGVERPTQQQQQQLGRCKEARSKTVGAAAFSFSNTSTTNDRSTPLTSSKKHGHHNGAGIKAVTKVNSHRHKQGSTVGSLRASGKTAKPQNSGARAGGKAGFKDKLADGDAGQKDSVVVLTNEQLQQILSTVQTSRTGQQPPEEHSVQGSQSGTTLNEGGGGGEMKEEDRGGGEVLKRLEGGGGVINTTGTSQDKDDGLSGGFFSWLEERQSDSRLTTDTKKAQWRRELDEQVALKQQQQQQQQRLVPDRPRTGEDRESVLSLHSSTKHREQPAAIRSSLKLGDITPVEEMMSVDRREEQRRCWLEELDRQREETAERRRREKLLQSQTEDHDLWTTHFDSLQRRPPVHTTAPPSAPPPAPSIGSERGEWEPSSSLSLVWDATSSCGAESVDLTNRFPSRASYLRTMTALLDPAQIEERERKRLKQLEQQRAIEAQVEERRQQREREKMRRREEEDRDARRVAAEREMLQRQYQLESQKEPQSQQAEEPKKVHNQMLEANIPSHLEESISSPLPPYRDTAVQTDASVPLTDTQRAQTPDVSAQYQAPVAPPNSRNPAVRTGKENIRLPEEEGGGGGGGDPYEAFARTERNKRDKRRPEWNTQKPSRRFVPASERYPAALQRNRQESRLKRQAELLALQERTCLSRTEPPPPLHQDPHLCSIFTKAGAGLSNKEETVSRGQNIPTVVNNERHRMQSRQAPNPLPPLVQEFVPYIRTDEITLDPLESADNSPEHTYTDAAPLSSASPPASSHRGSHLQPEQLCKTHTQRQQEILRGLAQLRQGLLQKQRELETDLNPLLKRHDNKL